MQRLCNVFVTSVLNKDYDGFVQASMKTRLCNVFVTSVLSKDYDGLLQASPCNVCVTSM